MLSDIINDTRERTITTAFNAAVAELKSLIEKNPFQTTFNITAGCVSEEMTEEISRRFNLDIHVKSIVKTKNCIIINSPL
jgi:hypothetical protein